MTSPWRLILDGPADGAWNMAVDAAILAARHRGASPPTLRLYGWDRPTVTLGRFQDVSDIDADIAAARGVGLARRPTGGRGVLHDDEVTYSIVASVRDGVPRGVTASYAYFGAGLIATFEALGLRAEVFGRYAGRRSASCFLQSSQADLSVAGAKLSGSAQVWSGDTVLQHGAIVLRRDIGLEAALFGLDDADTRALAKRASSLDELLEAAPAADCLREMMVRGFAETLDIRLIEGEATRAETDSAVEYADRFTVDAHSPHSTSTRA